MNALVRSSLPLSPASVDAPGQQQFLTFALAGETYALAIAHIKEIIEFERPTSVPQMPSFVRGVINLRGAVVPVIDLASRFGGAPSEPTRLSCVVILEVRHGEHLQLLGALVDAVHEVVELAASEIGPAPSFGTRVRCQLLAGMAKVGGHFIAVLDADRVLSLDELAQFEEAPAADEVLT